MTIKDKLVAGSQVGFGTAPLGNMFRAIPDAEAAATVRAAWEQGTRFFDTAPFYGAGLAELRWVNGCGTSGEIRSCSARRWDG